VTQNSSAQPKNKGITTWLLIAVVVLLAVIPLLMHPTSQFNGADGVAAQAITEIAPDAKPWFQPIWSPPGTETASMLFALQAALGAGFVGYFFGLKQGEKRAKREA
jgi:cobalt/nickel transport protein